MRERRLNQESLLRATPSVKSREVLRIESWPPFLSVATVFAVRHTADCGEAWSVPRKRWEYRWRQTTGVLSGLARLPRRIRPIFACRISAFLSGQCQGKSPEDPGRKQQGPDIAARASCRRNAVSRLPGHYQLLRLHELPRLEPVQVHTTGQS